MPPLDVEQSTPRAVTAAWILTSAARSYVEQSTPRAATACEALSRRSRAQGLASNGGMAHRLARRGCLASMMDRVELVSPVVATSGPSDGGSEAVREFELERKVIVRTAQLCKESRAI